MATPEIGLCTGKDCRKADGFRTVERELRRGCEVRDLACLDVCDGPVVVLSVRSSDAVIVERVHSRALALDLIRHLSDDEQLSARLRKRSLSGSKRAKARRRLART